MLNFDLFEKFSSSFQSIIIVLTLQVPSKRRRSFFLTVLDCFYTMSKTNNLLFCRFITQKSDLKTTTRRFIVPRDSPQRLASTSPNREGFG
jgi:hypothetical protein